MRSDMERSIHEHALKGYIIVIFVAAATVLIFSSISSPHLLEAGTSDAAKASDVVQTTVQSGATETVGVGGKSGKLETNTTTSRKKCQKKGEQPSKDTEKCTCPIAKYNVMISSGGAQAKSCHTDIGAYCNKTLELCSVDEKKLIEQSGLGGGTLDSKSVQDRLGPGSMGEAQQTSQSGKIIKDQLPEAPQSDEKPTQAALDAKASNKQEIERLMGDNGANRIGKGANLRTQAGGFSDSVWNTEMKRLEGLSNQFNTPLFYSADSFNLNPAAGSGYTIAEKAGPSGISQTYSVWTNSAGSTFGQGVDSQGDYGQIVSLSPQYQGISLPYNANISQVSPYFSSQPSTVGTPPTEVTSGPSGVSIVQTGAGNIVPAAVTTDASGNIKTMPLDTSKKLADYVKATTAYNAANSPFAWQKTESGLYTDMLTRQIVGADDYKSGSVYVMGYSSYGEPVVASQTDKPVATIAKIASMDIPLFTNSSYYTAQNGLDSSRGIFSTGGFTYTAPSEVGGSNNFTWSSVTGALTTVPQSVMTTASTVANSISATLSSLANSIKTLF